MLLIMLAPIGYVEGIKRWCASDVCLSRTSGLSLEQRGLGRLKLARK